MERHRFRGYSRQVEAYSGFSDRRETGTQFKKTEKVHRVTNLSTRQNRKTDLKNTQNRKIACPTAPLMKMLTFGLSESNAAPLLFFLCVFPSAGLVFKATTIFEQDPILKYCCSFQSFSCKLQISKLSPKHQVKCTFYSRSISLNLTHFLE